MTAEQSFSRRRALVLAIALALAGGLFPAHGSADAPNDAVIAARLAEFLRSARTVISQYQELINDPAKSDKGLTGDRVLAEATAIYEKAIGEVRWPPTPPGVKASSCAPRWTPSRT